MLRRSVRLLMGGDMARVVAFYGGPVRFIVIFIATIVITLAVGWAALGLPIQ